MLTASHTWRQKHTQATSKQTKNTKLNLAALVSLYFICEWDLRVQTLFTQPQINKQKQSKQRNKKYAGMQCKVLNVKCMICHWGQRSSATYQLTSEKYCECNILHVAQSTMLSFKHVYHYHQDQVFIKKLDVYPFQTWIVRHSQLPFIEHFDCKTCCTFVRPVNMTLFKWHTLY